MNTLTSNQPLVNLVLADGVYPYPDPEDQWVVIIGSEEVAWAATKPQAERSYLEMLHYDNEHYQHCPSDYIPFDGVAPETDDWADDYGLGARL